MVQRSKDLEICVFFLFFPLEEQKNTKQMIKMAAPTGEPNIRDGYGYGCIKCRKAGRRPVWYGGSIVPIGVRKAEI